MDHVTTEQQDLNRTGWSHRASVFFDHWRGLRSGEHAPTSESFLDTPNPRVQANTFIFDLETDSRTVFRLVGTEIVTIWGKDFTNLSVEEAFSDQVAALYLSAPRACIGNACGLWEVGLFGDTRQREVTLELMYLPLEVKPGRSPRLAGFLNWHGTSDIPASRMGLIALTQRRWIDIGSGVPPTAPDIFKV